MRLHKKTIHQCNVDNSLEIDCGPQNDTFLIGEADGQQTNFRSALNIYIDI